MLYSQADREQAGKELGKRRWVVFLPTAVMLLLAIASFVIFRLHRDVGGWIWTALITVLGGVYCIFFYDVYLKPVKLYKTHIDYMLDGNKRETAGVLTGIGQDIIDHEGMDCRTLTINIGDKGAPEDDRSFYLDALKPVPTLQPGDNVRILSNNRMVASLEIAEKES
ncbi:MAG: hypothetical protein PHY64_03465 [Eubacteriales bacterium]|nr:hypothetical protein [Eubacteriales bacterium]